MSGPRATRPLEAVPRLALSLDEAASALSISRDTLEREVLHELRTLRVGRRRLITLAELVRYVRENASRVLDDPRLGGA